MTREAALTALRTFVSNGSATPLEFDALLETIMSDPDAQRRTADLLSLLSDRFEQDHLMWSTLHCAEAANATDYAKALVQSLPTIHQNAPGWTAVLVQRLRKDSDCVEAAKLELATSPLTTQTLWKALQRG